MVAKGQVKTSRIKKKFLKAISAQNRAETSSFTNMTYATTAIELRRARTEDTPKTARCDAPKQRRKKIDDDGEDDDDDDDDDDAHK